MHKIEIRTILESDNEAVASIVRTVMKEFDADPATTILGDPSLDSMFQNYQFPRSAYFVLVHEGKIAGGCGIKKLDLEGENICELQRMFLLPGSRGKGFGRMLIDRCLQRAKEFNYDKIYLETLGQMKIAIQLYKKSGFRIIDHRLGNTGHSGCEVTMLKDL
jgi:putative acetyltransferase